MMDKLKAMLIKHEGLKLKPYRCTAGKLTIGVGRNLEAKGISQLEAEVMLMNDIKDCQRQLEGWKFFRELDEVRKAVLIDMCFNLGFYGLQKFEHTLDLIEHGKYEEAAAAMLQSKWAKQVGSRAERLSRMMKTGKWE